MPDLCPVAAALATEMISCRDESDGNCVSRMQALTSDNCPTRLRPSATMRGCELRAQACLRVEGPVVTTVEGCTMLAEVSGRCSCAHVMLSLRPPDLSPPSVPQPRLPCCPNDYCMSPALSSPMQAPTQTMSCCVHAEGQAVVKVLTCSLESRSDTALFVATANGPGTQLTLDSTSMVAATTVSGPSSVLSCVMGACLQCTDAASCSVTDCLLDGSGSRTRGLLPAEFNRDDDCMNGVAGVIVKSQNHPMRPKPKSAPGQGSVKLVSACVFCEGGSTGGSLADDRALTLSSCGAEQHMIAW